VPDLVNEAQYEGIDLDRGDPNDPDYWSPERVHKRNLWRDWAAKQRDKAAELTQRAAEEGMDANTALSKAGFADEKEMGKYIWTLFGNTGLFATQGNVDPNLEYDWASGRKTWKPGTENAGQSIPITREEYESRQQAQNYQRQGLMGYGAHANAEAFKKATGYGHFSKDAKSGMYYNIGQGDPNNPATWEWKDQWGRSVNGIRSGGPQMGYNYSTGLGMGGKTPGNTPRPATAGAGGYLPDQGSTAQYGGGGGFGGENGGFAGGVPDMYAGTKAAVGIPPVSTGQQALAAPRQQRAVMEKEDAASPYQQLIPKGSTEGQRKTATSGSLGAY
jgi:hypothetical protein